MDALPIELISCNPREIWTLALTVKMLCLNQSWPLGLLTLCKYRTYLNQLQKDWTQWKICTFFCRLQNGYNTIILTRLNYINLAEGQAKNTNTFNFIIFITLNLALLISYNANILKRHIQLFYNVYFFFYLLQILFILINIINYIKKIIVL